MGRACGDRWTCDMGALSIIIPVLDEATRMEALLAKLAPLRQAGAEIIVVDGGSHDATPERARESGARVVLAPRGRAAQMNAGAAAASGDVMVFLHADTHLPAQADRQILAGLSGAAHVWGRFDVRIDGRGALLVLVGWMMNARSRVSGIATGDQAMFVTREAFAAVGGFPVLALMEDVALSARLKRLSRPLCIATPAITSGRRWETQGIVRTILLMWWLRLAFFCGVSADRLARMYGYGPDPR
ncbi:MAG: TIGR04283 family arsenosugar biosynthesis glycosyltransferase [Proteobacteria bacterium]|nr:TIGR04283 family arsenosugar biosynthesis glycosyltransferase [Pseudomonadota bacterium]